MSSAISLAPTMKLSDESTLQQNNEVQKIGISVTNNGLWFSFVSNMVRLCKIWPIRSWITQIRRMPLFSRLFRPTRYSFKLSEIETEAEFAEVVKLQYLAFSKPTNLIWEALKGPNIEECTVRQWWNHLAEKGHHWLKVTDGDMVVGAAAWSIVEEAGSWYCKDPAWPEGNMKSMSGQILGVSPDQPFIMDCRTNPPYLEIEYCFVHPDYRRRGIGSLLIEWGCKIADKIDTEAFVEASDDGCELYKAHGFVVVEPCFINLRPETEEQRQDPEWWKLKNELAPEPFRSWIMWRPRGGKYEEGKTIIPGMD